MHFIYFLPERKKVPAEKNKSILDLALENDIIIEHNCGGNCACTSCIIQIKTGMEYFNKISSEEKYQLQKAKKQKYGFRLACKCFFKKKLKENITVFIPKYIHLDE